MADNHGDRTAAPPGPPGRLLLRGPCGTQVRSTTGHRWSDEAETLFLDQLAATCNVTLAGEACGFTHAALYRRRRNDAAFAQRWDAALAQGYTHLESLLLRRACDAMEGMAPDPTAAVHIPEMTVRDALTILGHHRRRLEGRPPSRREWRRRRPFEEARDSILSKLEAFERARRDEEEREAAVIASLRDLLGR
ncbi:MAG TPA: hypothetical protein VFS49_01995 [Croceibacterium sp.]|nr:hypothetical protein [Croceibacterium sp.]